MADLTDEEAQTLVDNYFVKLGAIEYEGRWYFGNMIYKGHYIDVPLGYNGLLRSIFIDGVYRGTARQINPRPQAQGIVIGMIMENQEKP
jgi:hypothetical protein